MPKTITPVTFDIFEKHGLKHDKNPIRQKGSSERNLQSDSFTPLEKPINLYENRVSTDGKSSSVKQLQLLETTFAKKLKQSFLMPRHIIAQNSSVKNKEKLRGCFIFFLEER